MILGSLPPMKCGVGDSMVILAGEISSLGKEVGILTSKEAGLIKGVDVINVLPDWSFKNFFFATRKIIKWDPDLIHFQFPSLGYKTGLLPYFLSLSLTLRGFNVIQTWHEPPIKSPFAENNFERLKRFIYSFRYLPNVLAKDNIVFVEKGVYKNLRVWYKLFFKRKVINHIPVTSNIPVCEKPQHELIELKRKISRGKNLLVYFGFLFPHKGVDQIFEIADPKKDHILLITSFDNLNKYHNDLKKRIFSLVEWKNNYTITGFINKNEVASLLKAADCVILPFRTETTLRNGSIFAAMLQGSLIITTSKSKSGFNEKYNISYNNPDDINGMKKSLRSLIDIKKRKKTCTLITWKEIAKMHDELYNHILK
jgi:glycosyltransferase involved in cell wall biosynthesis